MAESGFLTLASALFVAVGCVTSRPPADGEITVSGLYGYKGGRDKTSFSCRCAGDRMCFRFDVRDTTPCAPSARGLPKRTLEDYDRVEVFLSPTADMSRPYCCIELGFAGDVLDYRAAFYRQMDYAYSLKTLVVRTDVASGGQVVECSVALSELEALGLDPHAFHMGVFRADFSRKGVLADWYSAVPEGPGEPDFHRPCQLFPVLM